MTGGERSVVDERGQVTIPSELRETVGIEVGDEVVVREADGAIVVETPVTREQLAEGYRRRSERAAELAAEFQAVSTEADEFVGDVPEWRRE